MSESSVTIVSACLTGNKCRYDGDHRLNEKVLAFSRSSKLVTVCPEQLGGLPIPRPSAEICGGDGEDVLDRKCRVIDAKGNDVTDSFVKGALEVLAIAKQVGARKAVLKERSPSCGVCKIYRSGVIVSGKGVLTALLERGGIEVISDEVV